MFKFYRKTIALSDLWVSSNDKFSDFYASSWQRGESAVPLLVVRLILAIVALAILVWSVVEGASPYWLIYLTNWGLLLITLMTFSGVIVSCMAVCKKSDDSGHLPWYVGMYWFVYNVTITIAILITALYWILLYHPDSGEPRTRLFWLEVATHAGNSCIAFVEVVSSRTPIRFLHIYQPMGLGLWYAAFTGIYYAAGGTDINGFPFIYEVLDWRNSRQAGTIVGASVAGLIILYVVLWGIALCRDKASESLVRTTSLNLALAPPDRHMHTLIV